MGFVSQNGKPANEVSFHKMKSPFMGFGFANLHGVVSQNAIGVRFRPVLYPAESLSWGYVSGLPWGFISQNEKPANGVNLQNAKRPANEVGFANA